MATNIKDLGNKVENEGITEQGRLGADEFNRVIDAIVENQEAANTAVRSVSLNGGSAVAPDKDGVVKLYTTSGTSYYADLLLKRSTNYNLITNNDKIELEAIFTAEKIDTRGSSAVKIDGTIYIDRRATNADEWQRQGTVILTSKEAEGEYDKIDVSEYIKNGSQQIRLSAGYTVTDAGGNVLSNVLSEYYIYTIIKTDLSVQYAGDATQAWDASNNQLMLEFQMTGIVDRTLHVEIEGSKGKATYEFDITSGEYNNILTTWSKVLTVATDEKGLLTHGVKTIRAWLTASDGITKDALTSEKITAQRMVVVNEEDKGCYLLLQNLVEEATNYVQTTICGYVVYGPSASVPLTFRLTNYGDTEDYFRTEVTALTGVLYSLVNTIEIEDTVNDYVYPYMRVESNGKSMAKATRITVDNREKFAPTSGAVFVLNPKTRNNSEQNPETIINQVTEKPIPSTFENFGGGDVDRWVTAEDNQRVLRILAGEKLTIDYDWLNPFKNNNLANVTFEFDFKVSNITEEEQPILTMSEDYMGKFLGFQLKPLEGIIYTKSKVAQETQNFLLEEGARQHVAINITSALLTSTDGSVPVMPLCRVFLNGDIVREFKFDNTTADWYDMGSKMVIGHKHADIDIYGMRCYNKPLSTNEIMADYTASLPSAEQKISFRTENAILDSGSGLISAEKAIKQLKKNVYIWHGSEVNFYNRESQRGWVEIYQFDEKGNAIPELSGTICKETKSLKDSGQGTTAKTYADWNGQQKMKDITATIRVKNDSEHIHQDIIISEPHEVDVKDEDGQVTGQKMVVDIYGCGLGKRDWSTSKSKREGGAQQYDYEDGYIVVPDGWIDGYGLYRGRCYRPSLDSSYASKLQRKINYASSMQSHLAGANNAYNDLHKAVVGPVGMQLQESTARICKRQTPFLFFVQGENDEKPIYRGLCTAGGGKMDDATFRFDKKTDKGFVMMEGADNNQTLTDYRTPWESKFIQYVIEDGEVASYAYYNKAEDKYITSIDLDKYVDDRKEENMKVVNGEKVEAPSDEAENAIKEFVNFFYLHSPRLKYFDGTWDDFLLKVDNKDKNFTTYKWWCTSGDDAFKLRRFSDAEGAWVEAGWDAETEQQTIIHMNEVYATAYNEHLGDWDAMNKAFIYAIVEDARGKIGNLINVDSLKFHYMFVTQFIAGTDNCSKNTYICRMAKSDGSYWWCFCQDDMDTIFATDNSGYQNKPYYIDRQYPISDVSGANCYMGNYNVLNDLEEQLYEANGDNKAMMAKIFAAMATLGGGDVWKFLEKYFFSIQEYFPAICYNEQARIRYEYWEAKGFVTSRNIRPITQSVGDELSAERQFMKRRLILFGSYAGYGGFSRATGNLGIDDASITLGWSCGDSTALNFKGLVPHQYMYIGGYNGTTDMYLGERCRPGASYDFSLGEASGDQAWALFGVNYFRSLGNLGEFAASAAKEVAITGARLTDVAIHPSGTSRFNATNLVLNTPLAEKVDLAGCVNLGGALPLGTMVRLTSINTSDTNISNTTLPNTPRLADVRLGRATSLELVNLTGLNVFMLQDYSKVRSVNISGTPIIETITIIQELYTHAQDSLRSVRITDVSWNRMYANMLMWLVSLNADITGVITMQPAKNDRYITLEEKDKIAHLWGDIDSNVNALRIDYTSMGVISMNIGAQLSFLPAKGDYKFTLTPNPATGNDALIENNRCKVEWSLEAGAEAYANVTQDGVVHVIRLIDPSLNRRYKLYATIHKTDGSTVQAEREIGFWNRVPEVGDFAYGDGTFSDTWDEGKDHVGVAFLREPLLAGNGSWKGEEGNKRYVEGTATEGVAADKVIGYRLHVVCNDSNLTCTTTDKKNTYSTFNWGIYPNDSGGNGFTKEELAVFNEKLGVTDVCDLPLTNRGGSYLYDENNAARNYITGNLASDTYNTYIDDSQPDGYKVLDNRSSLMDFDGKSNTRTIISYANLVITNCMGENPPTTQTQIADKIQEVLGSNADSEAARRGCQPFYQHAYMCYLYEPSHRFELHDAYKKKSWYEPAEGELGRIYNFRRLGINIADANENTLTEARTPIFANANKRAGKAVTSNGLSWRFSSTELSRSLAWGVYSDGSVGPGYKFSRNYCLAVAAFDFEL